MFVIDSVALLLLFTIFAFLALLFYNKYCVVFIAPEDLCVESALKRTSMDTYSTESDEHSDRSGMRTILLKFNVLHVKERASAS